MTDTSAKEAGPASPARPTAAPTREEQRAALVRLIIVLAALAMATMVTRTTRTVAVVIAFFVMIMLHEFGHFITAKRGGMKVTEFFVGFGPRLWSIRKGETEYGVKALPLGGYVKIIGMHNLDQIDDPADEPRTYRARPFPQRLAVAVAGSTMHFIIAFLLFFTINAAVGVPVASTKLGQVGGFANAISPAEAAGFRPGDRILSVDGRPIKEWKQLVDYTSARPGQELAFEIERGSERLTLKVTPADEKVLDPTVTESRGIIGVRPAAEFERVNPIVAVGRAADQFIGGDFPTDTQVAPGLLDNARALGGVFSPSGMASYWRTLTGTQPEGVTDGTRFLSPVGFVRVAGQAAQNGLFEVLLLLIAINLFVGLFNLLPLLPLDGGHVALAVYEAIRSKIARRRYVADVAKLLPVTYMVVLAMAFLGISAFYLDIVNPLNLR
jgi:membrane-associated protease RseP (regulator of RpoE activity)